ncbi:WD40-repeat-containing domain protein [Talaromyces proteolyticus]|uniref:WD40-repeat-containing domain protein n=1 Tax=Talaromyces proteolyticus TaxID=1131652 RepID=A0AAD4KK28_9EURO|nr:WD40-repeat-containing domain protein [Talaromyces proteolyticus]KAH8691111.1 WD40-repeat-containing domain protein [Talaromyces proteolyticus]
MGGSDESSRERETLLSQFLSYRDQRKQLSDIPQIDTATRAANVAQSSSPVNHQLPLPKRRGRPPKRALSEVPSRNLVIGHSSTSHTTELESPPRRIQAGPQRPRRSNARLNNYYSKSNYSGYARDLVDEHERSENDTEDEEKSILNAKKATPSSLDVCIHRPQISKRPRVIYSSKNLQIYRQTFASLDEIADLPGKFRYETESNPSNYAQKYKRDTSNPILHVAFSEEEIEAMICLLGCDSPDTISSEMSLADQVIHVVRSMPKSRVGGRFIAQIKRMVRLGKLLAKNGFDTLAAYHQSLESVNRQMRGLIESLLNQIFTGASASLDSTKCLTMALRLQRRRKADISAFIKDAMLGCLPARPYYVKATSNSSLVQNRHQACRFSTRLQENSHSSYKLRRGHFWKGASNDVINLAWSPDGTKFAVGAAAQCDEHNMQYNRCNNLLLGDVMRNSIRELPAHRVPYPVANALNTHLYMSVSAVHWFQDALYTASYDKTVKVWDVSSYTNAICTRTLHHDHKVQVMARQHNSNILATATDVSVHLWHMDALGETSQCLDFSNQRSIKHPRMIRNVDLLPSSLAWGSSPRTSNLLVAGFSGKESCEGDACREGLLAMWQLTESSVVPSPVQPNAQNIFDVKFHPSMPWFATGSSVPPTGSGAGKGVRSLVRVYEPSGMKRCAVEFNCPALDINDVTFCPMDKWLISASCTDGVTYVWDSRNPEQILHRLAHGEALNQLDEQLTREQADVGVRVALWGNSVDNFMTGGSDGALKSWNVLRAPENVFIEDIAVIEDEIMSGAFSPDKSSLLVGDAAGGVHIFSPGADAVEELNYDYSHEDKESPALSLDSGKSIGRQLLSSRQLIQHSTYGVCKGPAYNGPYAAWARPDGTPRELLPITPLLPEFEHQQLDGPVTASDSHGMDELSRTILEMQRTVAQIRNKVSNKRRRSQESQQRAAPKVTIDLCSDGERMVSKPIWIDLTADSDDDSGDNNPLNEDSDLEDYWFPESHAIDANIRYSSV